ncbi:g4475 [Coccomyxa elongata]
MNRSLSWPKTVKTQKDWQGRFGVNWQAWTSVWWGGLLLAAICPAILAHLAKLGSGIRNIDAAASKALTFDLDHPVYIPSKDEAVRSYVKTDASLTRWQEGMSALYKQIVDTTPVGEISDSSMEFKFDGDSRRYMKRSITREIRAMAVTLYFTVAATLWLRESIHLALIMLQLNVLEGLLALKIKSLNDCVAKAVQQMLTKQMEFAMLPLEDNPVGLAQQQLCLQKMDLFYDSWSSARLGQSLRIPFRDDYIALHISVVASIIVATMVRALEIVLCGFYPGLPRFAIARRLLAWVTTTIQDMTEHVHQPSTPGAAGASGSSGGSSAAQGRWMGLRIGFMHRRSSSLVQSPRESPKQVVLPHKPGASSELAVHGDPDSKARADKGRVRNAAHDTSDRPGQPDNKGRGDQGRIGDAPGDKADRSGSEQQLAGASGPGSTGAEE